MLRAEHFLKSIELGEEMGESLNHFKCCGEPKLKKKPIFTHHSLFFCGTLGLIKKTLNLLAPNCLSACFDPLNMRNMNIFKTYVFNRVYEVIIDTFLKYDFIKKKIEKQNNYASFNFPHLSIPLCVTLTSISTTFLSL